MDTDLVTTLELARKDRIGRGECFFTDRAAAFPFCGRAADGAAHDMDHDISVCIAAGEKYAFYRLSLLEAFAAERAIADHFFYRPGF